MEKYLFRAKRKDNDEWIEGGYCYCSNESYIVAATRYIPDTRDWDEADYYEENPVYKPTFIKVYSETVGLYTGLTDKNGRKIFEGDIHEHSNHLFIIKYGKFNNEGYGWHFESVKNGNCEKFYGDENDYVNIIGNVHDNPELLSN